MTTLTQARAAMLNIMARFTPPVTPNDLQRDLTMVESYLDHQVAAQIEATELTARMLRAEGFVRECESTFRRFQHARLLDALPSQQARQDLAAALHEQVNLFGVGERVNTFPSSAGIADGMIDEYFGSSNAASIGPNPAETFMFNLPKSVRNGTFGKLSKPISSHAVDCMCTVCRPPL